VALQAQGQQVWVLEGGDSAESLFDAPLPDASVPIVLVVGHEKAGVDPAIVARADRVLHIPMVGVKESLNVAVALGIAAYWLGHQPQRPGSVHSA
jgi:TrmH family RNA methyltransferase